MIARVFHCHTRGFIFIVVFEISVLICQVDTIGNKMLALVYHWVTICGFSSVSARWLYRDTFLCFRTVTTIACEKYLCIWWTRTHGWSSCWNGIPPAMEWLNCLSVLVCCLKPTLLLVDCWASPYISMAVLWRHLSYCYSFILDISIVPLQVPYYLEALQTTALILRRS